MAQASGPQSSSSTQQSDGAFSVRTVVAIIGDSTWCGRSLNGSNSATLAHRAADTLELILAEEPRAHRQQFLLCAPNVTGVQACERLDLLETQRHGSASSGSAKGAWGRVLCA